MSKKLYLVETKIPSDSKYKFCYVVAEDPNEAYLKVKELLDDNDYGFRSERALECIRVIAENGNYPEAKSVLIL